MLIPSISPSHNTAGKPLTTKNTHLPKEVKPYKSDVFFKGNTQSHNTPTKLHDTTDALALMERGESAGNVLILFLKNGDFENLVTHSILSSLENTIPFVHLATKAPGIINSINNKRTEQYRKKLKLEMESFFKHPSSSTLANWRKAEQTHDWQLLTPADDIYTSSIQNFQKATNYIVGRPSPTLIGHEDLKSGIRRKNTAIGTMFLFRKLSDHTIQYNENDSDPDYAFGRNAKSIPTYGVDMLRGPNKFDLITALKIADLYKSNFTKKEMATFYNNLLGVISTDIRLNNLTASEAEKTRKLFSEKLKDDIKNNYVEKEDLY